MDLNLNVNAVAGSTAGATTVGSHQNRAVAAEPRGLGQVDASDQPSSTLDEAVESLQAFAKSSHRNLDFSIDEDSGQTVVKVVASDTGEVIRQIPTEVALKLARNLKDADGLLFNDKV